VPNQPFDFVSGAFLLAIQPVHAVSKCKVELLVAVDAGCEVAEPASAVILLVAGGFQKLLDYHPDLRFQLEVARRFGRDRRHRTCLLALLYKEGFTNE